MRDPRRTTIGGEVESGSSTVSDADRLSDASTPLISIATGRSGLAAFRHVSIVIVVADAVSIVCSIFIVNRWVTGGFPVTGDVLVVLLLAPFVWVGIFHSFGLYGVRRLSPSEEFRRLVSATTLGSAMILVGSFWWGEALHRQTLVLTWVVALVMELLVRRSTRWYIRRQKHLGRLTLSTVIAGEGEEALSIARALSSRGGGFTPVGFVSANGVGPRHPDLQRLGSMDDIFGLLERTQVECVFVASSEVSAADVYLISRACRLANIEMRVSANAPEVLTSRVSVQQLGSLMMLTVRPAKLTASQAAIKRTFDISLSGLALIVLAPLLVLLGLAIKVTSRGPVLFRQERVTKAGRSFTMYKFRTMVVDPERVMSGAVIDLTRPYFKMADDPRLTRFGKALRSLSLDELPQFWNVLRGDMSLVGPRPLPIEQVNANLDLLQPRHEVRAGMTGWWQVSGRSELDLDAALKMDLFYIENWSLSLDVFILLKTLGAVLARRGAY